MQTSSMTTRMHLAARPGQISAAMPRSRSSVAGRPLHTAQRLTVRAQVTDEASTSEILERPLETVAVDTASNPDPFTAMPGAAVAPANLQIFGETTEAINSRSAMLGFLFAVVAELQTNQSVWSQIAGKRTADGDLLESAIGQSTLGYFAVIVLVTLASLAPRLLEGEKPSARSFGPFTPGLEATLGRAAMVGFSGLVVVELLKGNTALF